MKRNNMGFKKYSSLENTYREKSILKYLTCYPELQEDWWVANEKIDGANISFVFEPGQKYVVCKRSGPIGLSESFFDIQNVLKKYENEMNIIQEYCDEVEQSFQLFGELFGPGINNRIDYGPEKQILFFDLMDSHGLYVPPDFFDVWIGALKLYHMNLIGHKQVGTLDKLLSIDVENISSHYSKKDNVEGIVLRPYKKTFYVPGTHERIILKKKSKKFEEKESTKSTKVKFEVPDSLKQLAVQYEDYITDNRILGIFSKYGEIKDKKEIGKYLSLIREDAKNDFILDHPETTIVEKDLKWIMSYAGTKTMRLLNKYL